VSELVKLMRKKRIHRVAVGDAAALSHVVTQSDIVSLFGRHLHLVQNKTLAELRLVRAVVSVMVDTSAAEAFRTLYDHRVSGIALLDEAGRVSANVRCVGCSIGRAKLTWIASQCL
jgi:CBS-domain-containing membrane protein